MVKNPSANVGDIRETGSIPGLRRSPGGRHGNSLQYYCLENSVDRGAWWATVHGVAQSWTQLRLQSLGSPRVGQTERLHFHFSLSRIGEGNGNPLQCSCLENPRDGGAWWAAVYGVAQNRTRLKRLSRSSIISSCSNVT